MHLYAKIVIIYLLQCCFTIDYTLERANKDKKFVK